MSHHNPRHRYRRQGSHRNNCYRVVLFIVGLGGCAVGVLDRRFGGASLVPRAPAVFGRLGRRRGEAPPGKGGRRGGHTTMLHNTHTRKGGGRRRKDPEEVHCFAMTSVKKRGKGSHFEGRPSGRNAEKAREVLSASGDAPNKVRLRVQRAAEHHHSRIPRRHTRMTHPIAATASTPRDGATVLSPRVGEHAYYSYTDYSYVYPRIAAVWGPATTASWAPPPNATMAIAAPAASTTRRGRGE